MLAVRLATCCERPIPKMLWTEHIRTDRDILGEADARHCQPPGAWRIVVHDLSPFDPQCVTQERGPIDGPSVPHKCAYVLGIDLNRSESSRQLGLAANPFPSAAIAASRVAGRRRAVFVLSECERPEPRLAYLCGGGLGLNLRAASAAEAGLMSMCQSGVS